MGEPTIFIRLTGCNLKCSFCDTKYAWENGKDVKIESILKKIGKYRKFTRWVCLTGGEPLTQEISTLVKALKKYRYLIQLETNGRILKSLSFDWITISPKPPDYFFEKEYLNLAKEVKIVVDKNLSIEVVEKISKKFNNIPVFLQPQSMLKWAIKKAYRLWKIGQQKKLNNLRLGSQLQRIYKIK
ncbi:MAG: 7-carboxy-7-deazaguanine synthase QueE [Candidatus Aminicenantia bacterium]